MVGFATAAADHEFVMKVNIELIMGMCYISSSLLVRGVF